MSSYSGGDQGECLEIVTWPDAVRVRDSKNRRGSQLALSPPPRPTSSRTPAGNERPAPRPDASDG
ncbi:DUF397 domain-containing protein [Streptomyces sp. LBL]|uniref:DUF397 domain-containing protein n=1 Tax=Streptomyces sp. LBL TaxID=2940562 RepID=UPI002474CFCE|nr:DUF397 domain-containing protein [Streptomyces sp. LBL]